MKRTKIICTIGPASESKAVLTQMIASGMDVARLNFSHGTYDNHKQLIANVRSAAKAANHTIAIMQDLQGPRIRVGEVHRDGIELIRGERVVFIPQSFINYKLLITGKEKIIPLGYEQLYKFTKPGKHILISDGLIDIEVKQVKDKFIYGVVSKAGVIFSHKGINLPGVTIEAEVITPKDKLDLKFGLSQNIDFVALSFVKDASNVLALRKLIGKKPVKIISKIERKEGLDNFDKILAVSDGIMVARGDLGIEIDPADVPLAQKEIIKKCMLAGKPVIVATQMLESMILNPRPTRAEVSDVANAVIDHTDAVMLSGESAFGKYPVDAVAMMTDIIQETEASTYDDVPLHFLKLQKETVEDAISVVADDLAEQPQVKAIVVHSLSGQAARMIARHHPDKPIIALTNNPSTQRQLAMTWGVDTLVLPTSKNLDTLIRSTTDILKKTKRAKKGDYIVLVTGQPVGQTGGSNLVKLHQLV